jgi:hypothetical protein
MKASRSISAFARADSNFFPMAALTPLPPTPEPSSAGAMMASILTFAISHSVRKGFRTTGSTIIAILSGSV